MRKRVQIALAVLPVALVSLIVWQLWRLREPVYQGRSLRAWVMDFDNTYASDWTGEDSKKHLRAAEALRQIGTNALPALVGIISEQDSSIKELFVKLAAKQSLVDFEFTSVGELQERLRAAFKALGPIARPAIPELERLLNNYDTSYYAAPALGGIGPDAVLPLTRALTNEEGWVRIHAVNELRLLQSEAAAAVPALLMCAEDENWVVRRAALDAIAGVNRHPGIVMPVLLKSLLDDDADVRESATNAVLRIDPEAVAKAGVK